MTFDQLEEKFIPVWESIQDFVPMDSKKESESLKRSGILLEKYPFQKTTLKKMLDHKCEVSEFNEDVIQMINLIRGQLKKE
ncbi:hypothetical protein Tco_1065389 [Tanacetum coccineum]